DVLQNPAAVASAPLREVTRRDSTFLVQQRGKIKRILDRDAGESQSTRLYRVRKKRKIYAMFFYDFFHTVLQVPLLGLYPIVFIAYALCHFLFAIMWWSISDSCAIGLSSLMSAFYFSVETQMTIGYGAPAENFAGCPEAVFLLPLQVVCGQVLDAAVIGIVFAQPLGSPCISASAHAASVMFSDTALLRVVDGCVQLTFRIAKRTGFSLSQGKIQVYCVQHHKEPSQPRGVRVEVNAMDLIEPDMDMYNGVIFLGLPCEVSHKVDFSSPLAPVVPSGTTGYPSELDVRTYLKSSKYLEILVLVSGVEQTTAASFEARHSYTLDDLFWDRTFEPCVSINMDGNHTVDLQRFHQSHMNRDEHEAVAPDRAVSVRTHHSFRATLEVQFSTAWALERG
ncbi:Kcnj6, partial [Symbiodinium pilosum]